MSTAMADPASVEIAVRANSSGADALPDLRQFEPRQHRHNKMESYSIHGEQAAKRRAIAELIFFAGKYLVRWLQQRCAAACCRLCALLSTTRRSHYLQRITIPCRCMACDVLSLSVVVTAMTPLCHSRRRMNQ